VILHGRKYRGQENGTEDWQAADEHQQGAMTATGDGFAISPGGSWRYSGNGEGRGGIHVGHVALQLVSRGVSAVFTAGDGRHASRMASAGTS
jgi:hypothetical protein